VFFSVHGFTQGIFYLSLRRTVHPVKLFVAPPTLGGVKSSYTPDVILRWEAIAVA